MKKYRIVEIHSTDKPEVKSFQLQRKYFWIWKDMKSFNGESYKDITFSTYKEAEEYLKVNFFFWGKVTKINPNEYHYKRYIHTGY